MKKSFRLIALPSSVRLLHESAEKVCRRQTGSCITHGSRRRFFQLQGKHFSSFRIALSASSENMEKIIFQLLRQTSCSGRCWAQVGLLVEKLLKMYCEVQRYAENMQKRMDDQERSFSRTLKVVGS